ncbi:amino acid adenylation domain-containing protein [Vibrio europaeus]|uniref:non-ribosomal peptide synthetase n=1 Tax=Vibrio europaeus TaxID=300876 RepID=UPI00233ED882|nr:non-ribosomal peptide synthetase [Vibrio europaeus]MDC5822329.1 amino acid adenylation domain-containing protein [Vibrio europaeus]
MSIFELVSRIRLTGLELALEAGQLKVTKREGAVLDEGMIDEIKAHRDHIIEFLSAEQSLAQEMAQGGGTLSASDHEFSELSDGDLARLQQAHPNAVAVYQATAMQEGMVFHGMFEETRSTYLTHMGCYLEGDVCPQAFEESWATLVARHDMFRTCFFESEMGKLHQVVLAEAELSVTFEDCSQADDAQKAAQIDRLQHQPLSDLQGAPLMALTLLKLAEGHYYFHWCYHHLLMDGWCQPVLLSEVMQCYQAKVKGQPVTLNAVRPYKDYIRWLNDQTPGEAQAFWETYLAGVSSPTQMAIDKLPMVAGAVAEVRDHITIPPELMTPLRALARRCHTTVSVVFQAAWLVLLSRYSGEQDVVTGTTISGRPADLPGAETMIGLFINTIPLRVTVDDEADLSHLLQNVHQSVISRDEHSYLPLTHIQAQCDVPNNMPLFDHLLVIDNYDLRGAVTGEGEEFAGIRVGDSLTQNATHYPLTMHITLANEAKITADYHTDKIPGTAIERLLEQFHCLLEDMAACDVPRKVGDLTWLPCRQQRQLDAFCDVEDEKVMPVAAWVDQQALCQGDKVAVVAGEQALSYRELHTKVTALASHLKTQGVSVGTKVVVYLERDTDLLVALLAVLRVGATYVPIDPGYPTQRNNDILTDSGATFILSHRGCLDGLQRQQQSVILLDDTSVWQPSSDADLDVYPVEETTAAYIIYTSGSTGQPKGVVISHGALSQALSAFQHSFAFTQDDVLPCLASQSFDISLVEMLLPLISGGQVLLLTKAQVTDPDRLVAATQGATVLHAVPSLMRLWLNHLQETHQLGAYPQLRTLLVGGEAVPPELVSDLGQALPECQLIQLYGPTENTVLSSYKKVHWDEQPIPFDLGCRFSHVAMQVRDTAGRECPVGVPGELYLGGSALAQGYLNQSATTADKFVTVADQRWYRSGDLVRWVDSGESQVTLQFLGRIDNQVKIRGFRVEPGEVAQQIKALGSVEDAVVVAMEDDARGTQLVAYVCVQAEDTGRVIEALPQALQARLPDYMVPAVFVPLLAMPLLPNGKLDRNGLPAITADDYRTHAYQAPQTEREKQLAQVWEQLLDLDKVGVHDNFFALGGHSLIATKMSGLLRHQFNIELPVAAVFTHPTIALLCGYLSAASGTPSSATIEKRDDHGLALASFSQKRLWMATTLKRASGEYNMAGSLSLTGEVDPQAVQAALDAIVERHEVLRTGFIEREGELYQRIVREVDSPYRWVDLSALSQEAQAVELEQLIAKDAEQGFDLAQGPLLRMTLVKLADQPGHTPSYRALFNIHHIACDAWSMDILIREFVTLYRQLTSGQATALPELAIQYADYAHWQRQQLAQEEGVKAGLAFWQHALKDVPTLHELPLDFVRPAVQGFEGRIHQLRVEGDLLQRLKTFCRRHSTTPYMVLQSVYAVLMARLSRQETVVIGSPISGRGQQETEALIGFFVNSMAIPSKVCGEQSFDAFLKQNQRTIESALDQQHIPFDLVVEHLNPQRSQSHHPVFQLLFAYQPASAKIPDLPALEFGDYVPSQAKSRLDLELYVNDLGEALSFNWHYSRELFAPQTIVSWADSLLVLLEAALSCPHASLASLSLQSDAQAQWMTEWNAASRAPVSESSFLELFRAQCAKTPDMTAVVHGSTSLSYRELDEKSTQLAQYLAQCGVASEQKIPVCLSRNEWLHIALIGVQKAGAAFVPIDPQLPDARLAYIASDCAADLILTEQSLCDRFEAFDYAGQVIAVDAPEVQARCAEQTQDGQRVFASRGLDSLAYIIYTSGSTGQPKGVLIEQQGWVTYLSTAAQQYINAEPEAPLAGSVVCTSISFDATLTTLFAPLLTGGFVELMPDNRNSLSLLADSVMDSEERLLFKLTPTHMDALLHTELLAPDDEVAHTLVIGGEQLSERLLLQWLDLYPNMQFCNEYGPTEAVVGCSVFATTKAHYQPGQASGAVPIGRAFSGNQLHILAPGGKSVPFGAIGELYVSGTPLARGYHNQPELTDNAFVRVNESRMYKTGDLVRMQMNAKGEPTELVFMGRADEQFKLRGYRIEPGEIESALTDLDGITQACVAKRSEADSHDELVAYLVGDRPEVSGHTSSELYKRYNAPLADRLPAYMLPSRYVMVAALPLTANGKLDRRALLQMEIDEGQLLPLSQPRTQTEEVMLGLWQDVLQTSEIGRQDDFFALGGHSLLATQLVSRIRDVFSVELSLGVLFDHSTLVALCEQIESLSPGAQLPDISVAPAAQYPLSYSQQRLWFVQQMDKQSHHYNMPGKFELAGSFDDTAFEYALNTILQRHTVLRSVFCQQGDEVFQRVVADYRLPLQVTDLSHLDAAEQQQRIAALETHDMQQPFALDQEIPCRFHLIKLSADASVEPKHVVLFSLHHIAADGWSLAVMVNEFKVCYEAKRAKISASLPTLPVQYGDFARWQKQWLSGEVLASQLQYWRQRLAGAPQLHDLATDKPRPAKQTFAGARYETALSSDCQKRISAFCRQHHLTLFTFLQTAFSVLISRQSGSQDIVMGSPISGRVHSKVEALIGFFVNTLVIRTQLDDEQTFLELAACNRRNVLEAFNHQHVPFELIVEAVNPERSLSHAPLVQITFALQNNDKAEMRLSDAQVSKGPIADRHADTNARVDLELHIYEEEDGLRCDWIYNKALFYPATIERMADNFSVLLDGILSAPQTQLARLPVVNAADQTLLLETLNATQAAFPQHRLLHHYPQTAREADQRIAVRCGDVSLSYAELHQQSERLARRLRCYHDEPGHFIAVCLPRSVEMIVAMLAVLKSGAAYLPIDPRYPHARIEYMLQDSQASVVISNHDLAQTFKFEGCHTLCVDSHEQGVEDAPSALINEPTPDQPAYGIYTSGSTGRPKGTVVSHSNASNLVNWYSRRYGFCSDDNTLIISAIGFDLTQKNIWATLATGGTVVLPDMHLFDVDLVVKTIASQAVTSLNCTPSVFYTLVQDTDSWAQLQSLKYVFLGGEPVAKEMLEPWLKSGCCQAKVINMYGPTECSDITVDYQITGEETGVIPIGAPIDNVTVYVLDDAGQLVPVGTPGELHIGGAGVTEGYLHQPALTAEKFISDPFRADGKATLYKTGDVVRWQTAPDGDVRYLEFLNRRDHQIKIRGHRVELSEVETRIRNHHDVAACRVQYDAQLEQIWAWVSPTEQAFERACDDLAQQNIQDWSRVFDETYEASNGSSEAHQSELAGWVSSYTGEMIPEQEMQDWVDDTVEQILALKPRKLLEVGVGTGLLFHRYVEACDAVFATDISAAALAGIEASVKDNHYDHVTLCHGAVETLDLPADCQFDTIVINSVIQYFPNLKYLHNTIQRLLPWLTDDGQIFIGDIRHFALLDAHNAASIVGTTERTANLSVQQVREQLNQLRYKDEELLVSPGYFQHLVAETEGLEQADISVKTGAGNNEMLRYRYDVVLHKAASTEAAPLREWHDWQDLTQFECLLQTGEHASWGVCGVPNVRILDDLTLLQHVKSAGDQVLVNDLRLTASTLPAADLPRLKALAQRYGYQLSATWSSRDLHSLDLVLYREVKPPVAGRGHYEYQRFANYPKIAHVAEGLETKLVAELSTHLPDFMLPAGYVLIDTLPTTPNGKVDVKALPKVAHQTLSLSRYAAPVTELQARLCELWQQVLRVPSVGVNDNFFHLGGHSLLATRLVSKLRSDLAVTLTISQIFEHPTIAELDGLIREAHPPLSLPPLEVVDATEAIRLSHAQKRLWFIDQLQGGSTEFNMPVAFQVHGPLDVQALKASLSNVMQRHRVLRSTIRTVQGEPEVLVHESFDVPFTFTEMSPLSDAERDTQMTASLKALTAQSFQLATEFPVKMQVIRLPDVDGEASHCLLINVHHIASDGWSQNLFVQELSEGYRAYQEGGVPTLPELTVQYKDYAVWQSRWLQGEKRHALIEHWQTQLADLPVVHGLPLDKARPVDLGHETQMVRTMLPLETLNRVEALTQHVGGTLFMFMQTAFALLLEQYSHEKDIVMGTPVAGRYDENTESLIGMFVNMLVLRTELDPEQTFCQLLAENKTRLLSAFEHQYLPFDVLVDEFNPQRSTSYHPLFQILIVLQNNDQDTLSLPGLDMASLEVHEGRGLLSPYDLELQLEQKPQGLMINWQYNVQLFERDSVTRMANNLLHLVDSILSRPEAKIADLPAMVPEERAQLTDTWSGADVVVPTAQYIPDVITEVAKRQPQAIAIEHRQRSVTYQALHQASDRLALSLVERGLKSGERVGIFLPRSPETIVSILAILKAGGTYVPLDKSYPADRLTYIISDAECKFVITMAGQSPAGMDADRLVDFHAEPRHHVALPVSNPALLDGPSYLIYTSGSTGQPKGVLTGHRAIATHIQAMIALHEIGVNDKVSQFFSFNFDGSVEQIFMALCAGATSVIYDFEQDRVGLVEHICQTGITIADMPPSLFQSAVYDQATLSTLADSALRTLVLGAETLPPSIVARWFESPLSTRCRLFNAYGPTEATVTSNVYPVTEATGGSVPIGTFVPGTTGYVVHDDKLCPIGVTGELLLGGVGLASGYWKQSALTERAFVEIPELPGQKLYRTGDLVRWSTTSGEGPMLEILGRNDQQVKIRGHRIDLGEIEQCLGQLAWVKTPLVAVKGEGALRQHLVAYLLPHTEREPSNGIDLARQHLQSCLPEYMQPSAFVMLGSIPVTANGKTDLDALPEPKVSGDADYVAPSTELQTVLQGIWQDLLKVARVSIDLDFFAAGGNSLVAIRLVNQINQHFGLNVPVRAVFEHPTIAQSAEILDALLEETANLTPSSKGDEGVQDFKPTVFVKLKKVGGTSLASSVLFPYCVKHGLTFVDTGDEPEVSLAQQQAEQTREKASMLFRHFPDFPKPEGKAWLRDRMGEPNLITLLRDPLSRAISFYNHLSLDKALSFDDYLDFYHEPNHQASWLGYEDGQPDFLQRAFTSVGITERFDESVLLFRHALGMSLDEVLYVKQRDKVKKTLTRDDLTPAQIGRLKALDHLDWALYREAEALVQQRVDALPQLQAELAVYQAALADLTHPLWQQRGDFTIGYSKRSIWAKYNARKGRVIEFQRLM